MENAFDYSTMSLFQVLGSLVCLFVSTLLFLASDPTLSRSLPMILN